MGVPKFYRWISERYPQINQVISDSSLLPEFDNLYLDMNGIIHGCTHPNDNSISKTLSLREMMLGMFRYIERLVSEIVKPKRVLFMAIDGVAPRAKLNQQRSRRFRAAQDRLESMEKARQAGEEVDEDLLFDTNCITPGTEFMDTVGAHIRWFIRKKMKEDPLWSDLEIIFSGHDVPGEGEHKIMQYIRDSRCKPDYQPNVRHCMVGQDADLIMLGLATHEPHFTLLREVVDFTGGRAPFNSAKGARPTVMRQSKEVQFQLMHLSVLREYIEIDLSFHQLDNGDDEDDEEDMGDSSTAGSTGIVEPLDRERLVDDFIFLTFIVGNDFLPHLPTLDISEHAFDVIFKAYRTVMRSSDGSNNAPVDRNARIFGKAAKQKQEYMICEGKFENIQKLEALFAIIGRQEQFILENRQEELANFHAKRAMKSKRFNNSSQGPSWEEMEAEEEEKERVYRDAIEADGGREEATEEFEDSDGFQQAGKKAKRAAKPITDHNGHSMDMPAFFTTPVEGDEEDDGSLQKKKDYHGRYYFEKFKLVPSKKNKGYNDAYLEKLTGCYLEGLMWCVAYYTKGCISWTWYYPYHYGPMLQDMKGLITSISKINFTLGAPFKPFQQLLGCLPPASKALLPRPYQWIMTHDNSPIISFYPETFGIDQDGKKNPWEAVVLLPFIDEQQLKEAEKLYCNENNLTAAEKGRNSFGHLLHHRFDPSVTATYFSCNPEIGLEDVRSCSTVVTLESPDLTVGTPFAPVCIPGTICPFAGFPSLTVLEISNIKQAYQKLNIFGSESRYKSIIFSIHSSSTVEVMRKMRGLPPLEAGCEAVSREYDDEGVAVEDNSFEETSGHLKKLLGRVVFVNYPLLHEAKVVGVTTKDGEHFLVEEVSGRPIVASLRYSADKSEKWTTAADAERDKYLIGRGVPGTGGLDIGDVTVRLHVCALQGMKRDVSTGATEKVFGSQKTDIPIQLSLLSCPAPDLRFVPSGEIPMPMLMPIGSEVIALSGAYAGQIGTIVGPYDANEVEGKKPKSKSNPRRVDVRFNPMFPEPPFGYAIAASMKDKYFSSKELCSRLKISPNMLGKIVGSVLVEHGGEKYDLGLNLKRNGQYQLLGYARGRQGHEISANKSSAVITVDSVWRNNNAVKVIGTNASVPVVNEDSSEMLFWEYSAHTLALMADYMTRFPVMFQNLQSLPHQKRYAAKDVVGGAKPADTKDILESIAAWMSLQTYHNLPRTPFTTDALSREAVTAIERAGEVRLSMLAAAVTNKTIEPTTVYNLPVASVFSAWAVKITDSPLALQTNTPTLGDRIVNLTSIGVPFGLRGTVIAIHSHTGYVEVVFDEEFTGGKNLHGCCSPFRGRLVPWSGVLLVGSPPAQAPAAQGQQAVAQKKQREPISSSQDAKAKSLLNVMHNKKKPTADIAKGIAAIDISSTNSKPSNAGAVSASASTIKKESGAAATVEVVEVIGQAPKGLGQFRILSKKNVTVGNDSGGPAPTEVAAGAPAPASSKGFAALMAVASGANVVVSPRASVASAEGEGNNLLFDAVDEDLKNFDNSMRELHLKKKAVVPSAPQVVKKTVVAEKPSEGTKPKHTANAKVAKGAKVANPSTASEPTAADTTLTAADKEGKAKQQPAKATSAVSKKNVLKNAKEALLRQKLAMKPSVVVGEALPVPPVAGDSDAPVMPPAAAAVVQTDKSSALSSLLGVKADDTKTSKNSKKNVGVDVSASAKLLNVIAPSGGAGSAAEGDVKEIVSASAVEAVATKSTKIIPTSILRRAKPSIPAAST